MRSILRALNFAGYLQTAHAVAGAGWGVLVGVVSFFMNQPIWLSLLIGTISGAVLMIGLAAYARWRQKTAVIVFGPGPTEYDSTPSGSRQWARLSVRNRTGLFQSNCRIWIDHINPAPEQGSGPYQINEEGLVFRPDDPERNFRLASHIEGRSEIRLHTPTAGGMFASATVFEVPKEGRYALSIRIESDETSTPTLRFLLFLEDGKLRLDPATS